jgi:hypothetical protein
VANFFSAFWAFRHIERLTRMIDVICFLSFNIAKIYANNALFVQKAQVSQSGGTPFKAIFGTAIYSLQMPASTRHIHDGA